MTLWVCAECGEARCEITDLVCVRCRMMGRTLVIPYWVIRQDGMIRVHVDNRGPTYQGQYD